MYHADSDKEKCDLHGERRQGLIEEEGQNQPEIELNAASNQSTNNVMHWRPTCGNQM